MFHWVTPIASSSRSFAMWSATDAEDAEAVAGLVVDELAVLRAHAAVLGVVVELAPLEVLRQALGEEALVVALQQVEDVVRDHRGKPAHLVARRGEVVADHARRADDRLERRRVATRLLRRRGEPAP